MRIFILSTARCVPALLFLFGASIHAQGTNREIENPFTRSDSDAQIEKNARENYARAFIIYYKNQGPRSREEADLTWKELAKIAVRPEPSFLNYVILQSALNTGQFEIAQKALIALGEIRADSKAFEISSLESLALKRPGNEWAVSIANKDENGIAVNTGSGTIISKDGWILTAAHVVAQTKQPVVVFPDGEMAEIKALYPGNFENDMVLAKVNKTWTSFAPLASGEPSDGDIVFSVGFPEGCIVPVKSSGSVKSNARTRGRKSVLTTISTLPGFSGSGVFNKEGELVGLVKEAQILSSHTQRDTKGPSTWLTPLSDIQGLFHSWKDSKTYSLKEREDWARSHDLWSSNTSAEQLFQKALERFYSNRIESETLLKKAYESGHMGAGILLGDMLVSKKNPTKNDLDNAFTYFSKAGKTVPTALCFVGCAKIDGWGTTKDVEGGIKNLKKASEQGCTTADTMLAYYYLYGRNVDKNEKEAVCLLTKAAQDGCLLAQYYLGICFDEGRGVEKNPEESAKWFKQSAEQGYALAQNEIAVCYFYGKGVIKDEKEEFKWRSRAAKQGDATSQNALGICYEEGIGGSQDDNKATEWYNKSADQGFREAQYNLGWCYADGKGVNKDEKESAKWFTKAAEQGMPEAQAMLGHYYLEGKGVQANDKEAAKWFTKSANMGYAKGQYCLGKLYSNGNGVDKDDKEALKWFTKAGDQGDFEAQSMLGSCFLLGRGVPKDSQEAIQWFTKSAEQGHALSQKILGMCYYEGTETPRDLKKAVYYLEAAQKNGNEESSTLLQTVKSELEKE